MKLISRERQGVLKESSWPWFLIIGIIPMNFILPSLPISWGKLAIRGRNVVILQSKFWRFEKYYDKVLNSLD